MVGALLPLIVTLAFGFFAGWHHDFTPAQASVLNRMVLLYALPLMLFAGMVTIKRSTLTSDLGLAAAITAGLLGTYLVTFLIVRFALRRPAGVSALTALAVGAPAIPFAGVVVLGYLYGPSLSAVPVAVGALVLNVIEVPVTLVVLSAAAGSAAASATAPRVATPVTQQPGRRLALPLRPAFAAGGAGQMATTTQPQTVTAMQAQATPASAAGPPPAAPAAARGGLGQHVRSAVTAPVVWAPVLALVLVLAGAQLPEVLVNAMKLLGSATTGVALFATGIVLFAQRITVSRFVVGAVAARNVVAPALVWVILAAIGMAHTDLRLAVLANALPAPAAAVIFAVQYRQGQREMASVVLFSSVGSLLTLAAFIALT
ncbi:MAG TPA: AEC family transporter [Streptosporangiaceae bacterium]|nr:AEC family transporter [Streptosporangiaceae bacterium]